MFKISKLCAIKFNSMNICLFSIKLPILAKISFTVIEILTFNKWFSEVYHFQKRAFLLTFHGVDSDVSIDAIVALAKQKQNGV